MNPSRTPFRTPPSTPGASPPDAASNFRGYRPPLRTDCCRSATQQVLISSSTTLWPRSAVSPSSRRAKAHPRATSHLKRGAYSRPSVYPHPRAVDQPLGVLPTRLDAAARPPPPSASALPSWVRSWLGPGPLSTSPVPADGKCNIRRW